MPRAQGRITVRRRPNDGKDAETFSFIPSASSIVLQKDGTPIPASFSVRLLRRTGKETEEITQSSFDGYEVKYTIVGSQRTTLNYTPGRVIPISNNPTFTSIEFALKRAGNTEAFLSIPLVAEGSDGKDAVTISVSPENVQFNYGKSDLRSVAVRVVKGDRLLTNDSFECSALGTEDKLADGLFWTFDTTDSKKYEYQLIYTKENDVEMELPFRVTVDGVAYERKIYVRAVKDGAQGMPGIARAPFRVRDWDKIFPGSPLTPGDKEEDEWTDVVYRRTNAVAAGVKYWKVKKYFEKASGQEPPASEDEYLVATSSFGNVATDLLFVHYALIKNLGVEAIEMRDGDGNLLFLAKDGTVTCNTGNFKNVNINNVTCDTGSFKNIHISGASTFGGFMFKEKTVITADNYSLLTTVKDLGYGDTRTELNLLKTGNWIEVKYTPPGDEYITAYLPSIRVGVAYSDTYRDYVRQFLGNEVIVYNSSTKEITVDSGESTRLLWPGFAVHFRMVFAPEKMSTDTLLERIKWEYSEPFQF